MHRRKLPPLPVQPIARCALVAVQRSAPFLSRKKMSLTMLSIKLSEARVDTSQSQRRHRSALTGTRGVSLGAGIVGVVAVRGSNRGCKPASCSIFICHVRVGRAQDHGSHQKACAIGRTRAGIFCVRKTGSGLRKTGSGLAQRSRCVPELLHLKKRRARSSSPAGKR